MDEHPEPELFELSGGALCLDFANTWGNHADEGSDGLRSYEQLVAFARQTGMLEASAAEAFLRSGAGKPKAAAAALALARELRQSVYRLFSARADCRDLPLADVDRINSVLGQALSHRRLERRVGGFDWSWSDFDETDLRTPVWPLIESAAALLTSDDLGRVRECDAEDCNWLFLDRSRSGSRRWCSMKSCGNRAKARRHYRRRRES
jgi:predicted RNA-binding Zn ribbon-like protein